MIIQSVRHKTLRTFLETGKTIGLDAHLVGRIRNMVAFLDAANSADELKVPPNFGCHDLIGKRAGTFSMTITKNWRLTFRLNALHEIIDLDMEDYH